MMSFEAINVPFRAPLCLAVLHVRVLGLNESIRIHTWRKSYPLGEMGHLTTSLSELYQQKCKQFCMILKIHLYQLAVVSQRKMSI